MRGIVAGLAGGVAWFVGLLLFFGPAQVLLTDPDLQSAKMLAAFGGAPPPPRAAEAQVLVVAGIFAIAVVYGLVYVGIASSWAGAWWRRGLKFALVSWALMVPWFEFYLPWNVLREPAPLVALEMACWAGVLTCVGLAIAGVEALLGRRRSRP